MSRLESCCRFVVGALLCLGCGSESGGDGGEKSGVTNCPAREDGSLALLLDSSGSGADWEASGVVTASSANRFTLDTCLPDSGCTASPTELEIEQRGDNPELVMEVPLGAFVDVHAVVDGPAFGAAQYKLTVRNRPTWEGAANPVASDTRWYVVASDGEETLSMAPFEVLATHLQCGDDDMYTVDFAIADRDGGAPIDVPETGIAQVELVGQKWNFESVRSAAPYCCDLPAPYAWWATLAQK